MDLSAIGRGALRPSRTALSFFPARWTTSVGDRHVHEVRIRVRSSYEPDTISARAGRPLRLTFHREDTSACTERVIFPAFGKSAMLPPFEDVTVELLPEQPGEYEFTCQMGMLRGRLLVSGDDKRSA